MDFEKVNHYSIWAEGKQEHAKPIQKIINDISQVTFTPSFVPHITVVGNIEKEDLEVIWRKMGSLVQNVHQFETGFRTDFLLGRPLVGPQFLNLNTILLLCRKSDDLRRLRRRGEEMFKRPSRKPSHLSLLYGPASRKIKVAMVKMAMRKGVMKLPFTIDTISLWDCSGGVRNWNRLFRFTLC